MKKLVTFIMSIMLVFTMAVPVSASSTGANTAVQNARKGVLWIQLDYLDDGVPRTVQGGSGFLIGSTSGAEYMITNSHVVRMNEETMATVSEIVGTEVNNSNSNLVVNVAVKADLMIPATIVNYSDDLDFAILKLSQPIYDREALTISNNEGNAVETQPVYALGFPYALEQVQDTQYHTTEDVNITNGIVSKRITINNMNYIQHGASIAGGNSGGPLVDQNGYVVGVNQAIMNTSGEGLFDQNYFYSIEISEVTVVLDMLGIQYSSSTGGSEPEELEQTEEPEQTEVPEPEIPEADKTSLNTAITAAGAVTLDGYTEESAAAFEEALSKAQEVNTDTAATQDEVNAAASALSEAQNNLEEKGLPIFVFAGIGAGVVVVLIIVIVLVSSSKKKKKKQAPPAGPAVRPAPPTGEMGRPTPPPTAPTPPPFHGGSGYANDGAGATTVLNAGAGETSVLGGVQVNGTLIRKKNNETIHISKQLFRIGKERAKVDYCVPDNNSISRVHAHIINKGGAFYIVDQNSTNFTFVNGNKIGPNQEVMLNSGDRIKISDEEFEFRA